LVEWLASPKDRKPLFRKFLHLENGLPSRDTFSRLLRLIDSQALSACFGRCLDAPGANGGGVVAIDGKTLRCSFDWPLGAQLVIGQKAAAAGGNEIPAACALPGFLDPKGALVPAVLRKRAERSDPFA